MKKTRVFKWIGSIGTSLLFLFTFILSMGGGLFGLTNDNELSQTEPITAHAVAKTPTMAHCPIRATTILRMKGESTVSVRGLIRAIPHTTR